MAVRIPDTLERTTPQSAINVRAPRHVNTTEGLVAGLRQVAEVGFDVQDREDKLSYSRAQTSALLGQSEALEAMDQDDYYDEKDEAQGHREFAQGKYQESVNAAIGEARELITNPYDREAFDEWAKLETERGRIQAGKKGFSREKDHAIATANDEIEGLRRAAVGAGDTATRATMIKNMRDRIDVLVDKGYLSEAEGQAMAEKATQDYAKGALEAMDPESQVEALRNPSKSVAGLLHADNREAFLRRAIAQRDADLVHAERARETEQKQLQRDIWNMLEMNGWDLASVPDFLDLDAERQQSLIAMSKSRAQGLPRTTNPRFKSRLERMAAEEPTAFMKVDLWKQRQLLSDEDFDALENLQNGLIANRTEALRTLGNLQTHKQVIDEVVRAVGFDTSPKEGTQDARDLEEIHALAETAFANFTAQNAREPNNIEMREITNRIVAEKITGWFVTDKRAFEITDPDDMEDLPPEELAVIDEILRQQGAAVNNENRLYIFRLSLVTP